MPRRAGLDGSESGVDDLSDTDEGLALVGDGPLFDEEDDDEECDDELESDFDDEEDE